MLVSKASSRADAVFGDAGLRAMVRGKPFVVRIQNRLAGTIHSPFGDGVRSMDSADHGCQLQSVVSSELIGQLRVRRVPETDRIRFAVDGADFISSSVLKALSVRNGFLTS